MKISKLLENPTPSSTSALNGGGYGGQAPHFGRDPEILEDEQIDETSTGATGSGSVGGGVASDLGMQRRGEGSIFKGVKTSKKFVNSPMTEDPLKDKSMDALAQAKNNIASQRMADLEQWEKDFRDSMAKKLKQKPSFEPVPVSKPGEKHSVLKSRMSNLDMAIQKHQQVEALAQKLDKVGRLSPAMQSAIDTRMHIKLGPKDDYQALNKKLDSILDMLNKNLNTYKIARKKPKAMREDGITAGINKYYDDRASGALDPRTGQRQPYLQQWALKVNGKVDGSNIFRSEQAAMLARTALLRKYPSAQVGLVTRGGLAEGDVVQFPGTTDVKDQRTVTRKQGNVTPISKRTSNPDVKLNRDSKGNTVAVSKNMHSIYEQDVEEAIRPIPVDDDGNRIPDTLSSIEPHRPWGQPGDSKSSPKGVVTVTPTGLRHKPYTDTTPRPKAVEEDFNGEYDDEAGMFKNNLQTIQRVSMHLEKAIADNENLPEWCQEKIGVAKSMVVTVMDYMISQHENGEQRTVDEGLGKTLGTAALAGAMALGASNAQAADLSAYDTRYLIGVANNRVPNPTVSVADARKELQARANNTQAQQAHVISSRTGSNQPANVISSRWGSNQPDNANVITSRGIQREGVNENPKVDLSPNYPNYATLVGEFIGMRKNRALFKIIAAELKPGVRETEKIFKARTTNTPISVEIGKVKNRTVLETELSEESLLAKALAHQLELFNKADDRDLGSKPEDKEIITKEQAAHVPTMVNRLESEISKRMAKEHPEVIEQYGTQIVQDAIANIAVYNRHMRQVTTKDVNDMIMQVIQQLNRHIRMKEEKQRLDPKCWKGYKKQGTKMKGDTRVNNCVPK